ncbi:MAG: type II secretion system minor pseudopilin GspK [Nevskia sp.]|nr:type II secretion system minor pseudopilin GspK [Nevskia sp.]
MSGQRGIALVTAIFVVMLATIAAVAMVDAANFAVHRSVNLGQSEAQWWYAEGIEAWVKGILARNAGNQSRTDGLGDAWAQPVDFLPIDGGAVRGRIEDLQGRFNLNNLAAPLTTQPGGDTAAATGAAMYMQQFERLLDNLPGFDGSKYHGLSYAIRDWIDADSDRSGTGGAEDQDYLGLDPPYRAANQPMRSTSELLLVRGVTPELFAALQPYVAALPAVGTPINVNTAPEPVLLSLATQIDRNAVEKFIAARKANPVSDVAALHGTGEFAFLPATVPASALGVGTHYFLLQAQIFIGSGRLALYSVIYRPDAGSPVVLAHSTNSD